MPEVRHKSISIQAECKLPHYSSAQVELCQLVCHYIFHLQKAPNTWNFFHVLHLTARCSNTASTVTMQLPSHALSSS